MTDHDVIPLVHDRNGVAHLDWDSPLIPQGGMIDKAKMTIKGRAIFNSPESLEQWLLTLPDTPLNGLPQFLGRASAYGQGAGRRKQVMRISGGWTIKGKVVCFPNGSGANIEAELFLNPTRTLNHLLAQYTIDEIANVEAADFFLEAAARDSVRRGIDGQDNVVTGLPPLFSDRMRFLQSYLVIYESKLQRFLMEELHAVNPLDPVELDGGDIYCPVVVLHAGSERPAPIGEVRLRWGEVQLNQVECYWERSVRSAVPWVLSFADRCMAGARGLEISHYVAPQGTVLSRRAAALSVAMPHDAGEANRRHKELVVYAKTDRRIRFEERYHADLPRNISAGSGSGADRLSRLFVSALEDAAQRLNWDRLADLMRPSAAAAPEDIFELADFVRDATSETASSFRPTLTALLVTGGISVGETDSACPVAVAQRLAQLGVVEAVRLVRHQRYRDGHRLRLAAKFNHLRSMFRYEPGQPIAQDR